MIERWEQGQIDAIITTSSEGLRNIFDIMGERQDLLLRCAITVMNECMAVMHENWAAHIQSWPLLAALVAWRTGLNATEGRTTQSKVRHNENG